MAWPYTRRWRKAATRFIELNPLCVMCAPRVVPATVVDHVIPHRGDMALFWDEKNWQSLCAPHHNRDKQSMEKSRKVRVGLDGWPEKS